MFHESPVSLFSFQDIITSLTGIMIFFLLVFSINILELTLEQEDKKLKNLAAGIEEKKKLISEIRKAIAKRRKEVQITIDSSIDKIPILIELSVEKICIVNTQSSTKRIFPRKSPIMPELVADAISYLRLFSPDKYYFVIMVKPSAVGYINFFLSNLRDEIKNASYGLEPIRENEGVTNE